MNRLLCLMNRLLCLMNRLLCRSLMNRYRWVCLKAGRYDSVPREFSSGRLSRL
jgi:hypothetical protein